MKKLILSFVFGSLTAYASDSKKICDLVDFKYHDVANPSHEVTISGKTMIVGGEGEVVPPNMDHLAVQRGLINCAPRIFECLKKEKAKLPTEFKVSFELTPSGEIANASKFKFSWILNQSNQAHNCLSKIWSETQYGLIIKEMKKISIPIKIK